MGGADEGRTIAQGARRYRPLRELLLDAFQLLQRPILIAETGAEGALRAPSLRCVYEETRAAMAAGVPVEDICLYPVLDHPAGSTSATATRACTARRPKTARPGARALAHELWLQRLRFENGALAAGSQ